MMAHSYSHIHGLPATGLRFFTVYGPWGRPDMALFRFTRNILAGEPSRSSTTAAIAATSPTSTTSSKAWSGPSTIPRPADPDWDATAPDPATSHAPYRILNIGNQAPMELERYIETLEKCLGRTAVRNFLPLQPGDVPDTSADIGDLAALTGYRPRTSIEEGVPRFVEWYREYYGA